MEESGRIKRIRISRKKYGLLRRCFVADLTASQAGQIALVNRNTANRYYNFFRDLVIEAEVLERSFYGIRNGAEIDESYFGPKRVRGKRGRGAGRKVIVFGLRRRSGNVYTEIVPDVTKKALLPIIRRTVKSGSDIYSDGWCSYDALAIYGYNHKKVKHEDNEFAKDSETHINGIESFWAWTKRRLNKFNGVSKREFKRYLLESEWRFNHRDGTMKQLKLQERAQRAKR